MQSFGDGRVTAIDPQRPPAQMDLTEAVICFGKTSGKFQVNLEEAQPLFIVGLEPKRVYQVEVDDEEMAEVAADPTGILELDDVPSGKPVGVRIR
jgi:hypothetical protein